MQTNLRAPINLTSYGYVSRYILKELAKRNVDVALWPIGAIQLESQEEIPIVRNAIEGQKTFRYDIPCLTIFHQFALAESVGRGQRIGWPIFELNTFEPNEKYHIKSLDHCVVCSEWAKEVICKEIPEMSVSVITLGVDTSIFTPTRSDSGGPTIFFNAGKWEVRKGHDILVDAFNLAFTSSDNVELWLMPTNPFLSQAQTEAWVKSYKNSVLGDKIKILPRVQTHREVAEIMRRADCGVFPSRAEGWNLEALEMMACGKPVILTNYSGHTAFANTSNSLLIDCPNLEPAYDGIWFHGTGQWADLGEEQLNQLISYMRIIHKEKTEEGFVATNTGGIATAATMTWSKTAEKLLHVI